MAGTSPTQRTLQRLRDDDWTAQVVEKWNPFAKIRQDLFGFVDVFAVRDDGRALLVQATSGSNHAARRVKLLANKNLRTCLLADLEVEVWSWAKQGPRGKRKTWQLRREAITLADLEETNDGQ